MNWAVISDTVQNKLRANVLSTALNEAGIKNQVHFVSATPENLNDVIQNCSNKNIQYMRFEGSLADFVPSCFNNLPSTILTLKSADAIVPEHDGRLWPRNFFQEGMQRLAAGDLGDLDLTGAAFVIGARPETRASIAALVRIGFRRINLTCIDDKRGEELLTDFKRTYFNVQFTFTPRSMITQLPGVHSIAVNTISMDDDPNRLSELFYFNFLKAGAIWIAVPMNSMSSPLIQEAKNVGAEVCEAALLAARVDQAWAESCFKVRLDHEKLRAEYSK
jgi:shikimate 5-dehydrogenase